MSENRLEISGFQGVDFSNNVVDIDTRHSPDSLNMILDEKFRLTKRKGYEIYSPIPSGEVNGMYSIIKNGEEFLFVHISEKITRIKENEFITQEIPGVRHLNGKTKGFVFNDMLYVIGGGRYLRFDGTKWEDVSSFAYIPTVRIGMKPDGSGTNFESVNLLTNSMKNSFIGDGSSTVFYLSLNGTAVVKSVYVGGDLCGHDDYSVSGNAVTFKTAPPDGKGIDNVVITFSDYWKDQNQNISPIEKCDTYGIYGGDNDTRVFLTGNPEEPNVDYQSGLYDPTYFPDTGYTKVGSSNNRIMGYAKVNDCQIIVKSDNRQSVTHYLRTFSLDSNNTAYFPIKQGIEGVGAINQNFINVMGRTLYLSSEGLLFLQSTDVNSQYITKNVSKRINGKLKNEKDLQKAKLFALNDKIYICVNGHCYVGDTRLFSNEYGYEWQYWDIKAEEMGVMNNTIYFVYQDTVYTYICRFNDSLNDENQPINSYWKTGLMNLGTSEYYKNVTNIYLGLTPLDQTQKCDFGYYNEDGYSLIDNIEFEPCEVAEIIGTGEKVKKTEYLQLEVKNDEKDGILSVERMIVNFEVNKKIK